MLSGIVIVYSFAVRKVCTVRHRERIATALGVWAPVALDVTELRLVIESKPYMHLEVVEATAAVFAL